MSGGIGAGGVVGTTLADHGLLPIDRDDLAKPTMVAEYINDIYKHHRACEKETAASCTYMAEQEDINDRMRAILIDWLVEVHLKFKLTPETLYLTVNIIDRFLQRRSVMRSKLQLVGVTAMLLASKYEEIYAPEVRDFVYITDKAYTREQILTMESVMLNALKFKVTVPTTYVFLNRFLRIAEADSTCKQLACFIVERQMQEYGMLKYLPSEVAAAAVNMALRTLRGETAWTTELAGYSGYSQDALATCIRDMQHHCTSTSGSLGAVRKKYSLKKFGGVSEIRMALIK